MDTKKARVKTPADQKHTEPLCSFIRLTYVETENFLFPCHKN